MDLVDASLSDHTSGDGELGEAGPAAERLFVQSRSHNAWMAEPVSDSALRRLHELTRWGPTSANGNHGRFVFVRSDAGKARLPRLGLEDACQMA